jgi:hypothetical protein
MTTYRQPLQRESDKRWDFTTSTGSTKASPIGYCAGWKEPPGPEEAAELDARLGQGFAARIAEGIEEKRPHQAKYHTEGHATAEEACECYHAYELDNELEFKSIPNDQAATLHRCEAPDCKEHTAGVAFLGQYNHYYLCDAHRNRENVELVIAAKKIKKP